MSRGSELETETQTVTSEPMDVNVSTQEPLVTSVAKEGTYIPFGSYSRPQEPSTSKSVKGKGVEELERHDSEDTISDGEIEETFKEIEEGGYERIGEGEVEKRERLEREEIQKKSQGSNLATSSRATTSRVEEFGDFPEFSDLFTQDVTRPVTQLHTLPSHSESPLGSVSKVSSRGIAHDLSMTHSESLGIETEETPRLVPITHSLDSQTLLGH